MLNDGSSESKSLKDFYNFTFTDKTVQNKLIKCTTVASFAELAIKLARSNGFYFTELEMKESLCTFTSNELPDFDTKGWEGYEWQKKISDVGWSPLGYSRN